MYVCLYSLQKNAKLKKSIDTYNPRISSSLPLLPPSLPPFPPPSLPPFPPPPSLPSSLPSLLLLQVNTMGYGSWLVIFLPSLSSLPCPVHPATWDGVVNTIKDLFPILYPDFAKHFTKLKECPYREFEHEAGFKFLDSLKRYKSRSATGPPYYDYEYTCTLPRPLKAWQVRAFLYCELRLLELFDGNGHTKQRKGTRRGPWSTCVPLYPSPPSM